MSCAGRPAPARSASRGNGRYRFETGSAPRSARPGRTRQSECGCPGSPLRIRRRSPSGRTAAGNPPGTPDTRPAHGRSKPGTKPGPSEPPGCPTRAARSSGRWTRSAGLPPPLHRRKSAGQRAASPPHRPDRQSWRTVQPRRRSSGHGTRGNCTSPAAKTPDEAKRSLRTGRNSGNARRNRAAGRRSSCLRTRPPPRPRRRRFPRVSLPREPAGVPFRSTPRW